MAAVLLTPGRPLIEIGRAPRRLRLSIGRIDAHLGVRPGAAHCICSSPPLSRARDLAISAAGPCASAIVAGLWFWVSTHASRGLGHVTFVLGLIELTHAAQNLVPREFERPDDQGRPRRLFSDGAHIRAVLLNRPLIASSTPPETRPAGLEMTRRGQAVMTAMLRIACAESGGAVNTDHLLRALVTADARTREILSARGWSGEAEKLPPEAAGPPPPTPALRRILDATRASLPASAHAAAEPEHLLLALLRSGETAGREALAGAGVDLEGLRADLIAVLANRPCANPRRPR